MSIPFFVAAALLGTGTGSGEESGGGGGGGGSAPTAPTNFQVAVEGDTSLTLTWTDATGETFYRLERGTSPTNFDTVVEASLAAGTVSYEDTGLTNGVTYYYLLTAGNSNGETAAANNPSGTPSAAPPGTPTAPSNLAAAMQATNTTIRLTWTDNSGNETGFKIYRSVNGGSFSLLTTAAANATQHDDTGLTLGNDYAYKISAENGSGESVQDGPATITNLGAVGIPTGLTATLNGTTQIDLSWSYDDSPPNGDEDGFVIYRDDVQIATTGAGVTTYEDTGLADGTLYSYKVAAQNGAGEGTKSDPDSAATTLPAPSSFAAQFIGDEGSPEDGIYRFTWTDNSDNEVAFTLQRNTGGGYGNYSSVAAGVTQADVDFNDADGHLWRVHADGGPGVSDSDPSNAVTAQI